MSSKSGFFLVEFSLASLCVMSVLSLSIFMCAQSIVTSERATKNVERLVMVENMLEDLLHSEHVTSDAEARDIHITLLPYQALEQCEQALPTFLERHHIPRRTLPFAVAVVRTNLANHLGHKPYDIIAGRVMNGVER